MTRMHDVLAANYAKCANVRAIGVIGGEFQSASSAQSAAKSSQNSKKRGISSTENKDTEICVFVSLWLML